MCPNSWFFSTERKTLEHRMYEQQIFLKPKPLQKKQEMTDTVKQRTLLRNISNYCHGAFSTSIYITLLLCGIAIFCQKIKDNNIVTSHRSDCQPEEKQNSDLQLWFCSMQTGRINTSKTHEEYD